MSHFPPVPPIQLRGVVARVKMNRGDESGPACQQLWLAEEDQMTLQLAAQPVRERTALRANAAIFPWERAEKVAAEIGRGCYPVVASMGVPEIDAMDSMDQMASTESAPRKTGAWLPPWRKRPQTSVEEYQDRREKEYFVG